MFNADQARHVSAFLASLGNVKVGIGERMLIAYRDSEEKGAGRRNKTCDVVNTFLPCMLLTLIRLTQDDGIQAGYLVSGQLDSTDLTGFKDAFLLFEPLYPLP